MKTISNIKAFAANLAAVVYANKHFLMSERTGNGDTILYRAHQLSNGDVVIEGFRASMADGSHKTYESELAEGYLWVGSKRRVLDDLSAKDRLSTELVPLKMHFHESKFPEFFIAEDKPLTTNIVRAAALKQVEEAVEA
jgi:hypothetical protein